LVEWWLLAGAAIMWVVFLVPFGRERSERRTITDHERRMELLASAEVHGTSGRWIVTPRKGMRFLSPRERQRARARERRRHIFVVLIEGLVLTLLIGLVPPLRPVWYASAAIAVLLVVYVWLLLVIKAREPSAAQRALETAAPARRLPAPQPVRHVADSPRAIARPVVNGLGSLGEGDRVHVVVKGASAG
jgi:Flp pilus assembly protein TadB